MLSRRTHCAAAVLLGLAVAAAGQSPPGGAPAAAPAAKGKKAGSDIEIVEKLLTLRKDYQMTMEALRASYIASGDLERAKWAEEELLQFHRMSKHAYRLELEVPPPTLQANYNIPEANELYRRAMLYKDKGWGSDYIDNQRRAELLLQQLLSNHPQSDKIAVTAYQLGDIYESKAYKHYGRAAQYFERCFQWNSRTQLDARIRAARLYEKTGERVRAIEIYKEIGTHEVDPKRIDEATKRLADLSGKR